MKYLGADAPKTAAYGVASISGSILAVCSCTVLPLFAGIWRMGAGLGPAVTFLYAGPAINVLAIVLTAAVLGPELGVARAICAIAFSIIIGIAMNLLFRHDHQCEVVQAAPVSNEARTLSPGQTVVYFLAMIGILVFANWGKPQADSGPWNLIWSIKWILTSVFSSALGFVLVAWFGVRWWKVLLIAGFTIVAWIVSEFWLVPEFAQYLPGWAGRVEYGALIPFTVATVGLTITLSVGKRSQQCDEWFNQSWGFAKQIMPLLFLGVFVAGFLLGRPDRSGFIPDEWIVGAVGGNSLGANLLASIIGAFMYFATLTEIPILQGLMGSGMGKGPALALLLSGPALSLPNMLVIRSIIGTQKTVAFIVLVVVCSAMSGWMYGAMF